VIGSFTFNMADSGV